MNKKHLLEQIETIKQNEKQINAFINFDENIAINNIEKASGKGSLAGLSYAMKDNINIKGTITTGGSLMLKDYISPYSATIYKKLVDAGAIYFGKANLDEFAMGIDTSTSAFGTTLNPLNHNRSAGGSSGGSGAAVAADFTDFSIGTDTGGSVRLPAAYCGLVGIKPTYGTVSRFGIIPMANSLDQAAPITKDISHNIEVLDVIMGKDSNDPMSVDHPKGLRVELGKPIKDYKIAYINSMLDQCDPQIKDAYFNTIEILKNEVDIVDEIELSEIKYAPYAYYIVCSSEVFSNFSRFDGIKYGPKLDPDLDFLEGAKKIRNENFGYEVKKRILQGAHFLAEENYQNFYVNAAKYRTFLIEKFQEIFSEYDLIILPTTLVSAAEKGSEISAEALFITDLFTTVANLAGIPAISLPNGKIDNNLHSSIQIMANYFDESKLYNLGLFIESQVK
jgi:aspartyl-tRNA(Asn)/glutamyl-tRNA(Gln) amidotransferase subunit A